MPISTLISQEVLAYDVFFNSVINWRILDRILKQASCPVFIWVFIIKFGSKWEKVVIEVIMWWISVKNLNYNSQRYINQVVILLWISMMCNLKENSSRMSSKPSSGLTKPIGMFWRKHKPSLQSPDSLQHMLSLKLPNNYKRKGLDCFFLYSRTSAKQGEEMIDAMSGLDFRSWQWFRIWRFLLSWKQEKK